MQTQASRLSSISVLSIGSLFAAVLGILIQSLLAFHFGVGLVMDSYFMALSIGEFFGKLLLLGQIANLFMPAYTSYSFKNSADANEFALDLFILTISGLFIVYIASVFFGHGIVNLFAPGYSEAAQTLCTEVLWISLPASLLAILSTTFWGSILNSRRQFGLPVIASLSSKLVFIILLVLFGHTFGARGLAGTFLLSSVSGFLLLALNAVSIRNYSFSIKRLFNERIRQFYRTLYPFLFNNVPTLGAQWVYRAAISSLEVGSMSALGYGRSFFGIVNQTTSHAIHTTSFSEFANLQSKDERHSLYQSVGENLRLGVLLTFFFGGFLSAQAPEIMSLLLLRGKLDAAGLERIIAAVRLFAVLLYPMTVNLVLSDTLYVLNETRYLICVSFFTQIVLAALYYLLSRSLSFEGIILAQVAAYSISDALIAQRISVLMRRTSSTAGNLLLNIMPPRALAGLTVSLLVVFSLGSLKAFFGASATLMVQSYWILGGGLLWILTWIFVSKVLKISEADAVFKIVRSLLLKARTRMSTKSI